MKKIADLYYDETGLCPVCGEGLVPVTVYSGKALNTHVRTEIRDINTKVRTTTTTYTDIEPLYVGYCLACAKRAHDARQEQKAAVKPKPTCLVVSIVCALLLIPGVIGAVRLVGSLGRVGLWGSIGVISLLIVVFFGLPVASIAALVTYLKKNKQHRQYAAGAREPFAAPSEESMSRTAAYYMNKQPVRDREYLSIEQVKRMSHTCLSE